MTEQIEIEFKNLLTHTEFIKVKEILQLEDTLFKKQVNHYFDTKDFSLKNSGSALRIREKKGNFELTLKQPRHGDHGLLETNQLLTEIEAKNALEQNILPEGLVLKKIEEMNVSSEQLLYFGSLSTIRAELQYKEGLMVLDHSIYLNSEDFELEYEVEDYLAGQASFLAFLAENNIPIRETKNKIQRFYERKKAIELND